uniref:NADH dehydrogenase subunit 5 n=1 Tax=Romanomermis culicivorax TaxID=13658 RepID=A0A915JNT4_ROMCU
LILFDVSTRIASTGFLASIIPAYIKYFSADLFLNAPIQSILMLSISVSATAIFLIINFCICRNLSSNVNFGFIG